MDFDLVHRRCHVVMHDQVHQPVRWEVADPDGADPALPVQRLHVPPGTVDISDGLVDQVQIEIVQLQPLQ